MTCFRSTVRLMMLTALAALIICAGSSKAKDAFQDIGAVTRDTERFESVVGGQNGGPTIGPKQTPGSNGDGSVGGGTGGGGVGATTGGFGGGQSPSIK
jgi:hypothetical protein